MEEEEEVGEIALNGMEEEGEEEEKTGPTVAALRPLAELKITCSLSFSLTKHYVILTDYWRAPPVRPTSP